ncbi:CRISPR-associated endonuclease Cas1 [Opitutaceae bacterium TAV1]|nr:CRISPR-associated endonuclease Cas1 [Opitutaceae bacterium TAV1]
MPSPASDASIRPSGGDTPQDDPLQARMLNEFVYCPRLFYYEYVESVFEHNADTRRGAALHKRVDAGKGALPPATPGPETDDAPSADSPKEEKETPDIIHTRSVSLASDRLGVIAKMDLIEVRPPAPGDGTPGDLLAPLRVTPVDYKIGSPREGETGPEIWDADRMQLGLQCLILRDQGYACDEGIIYYRATKQRVPLLVTTELENWIHAQIAAARRCMTGPIPPPLADSPKCPRCSLVTICLPDETRLLREAPAHPDDEDAPAIQDAFPFDRDFAPPRPANSGAGPSALPAADPATARRLVAARDDERELYITTPGTSLGKKSELIQIREKGELVNEFRIKDLSHVAIFGSATISTALLNELAERDIAVSYFTAAGTLRAWTRGPSLKNVFTRIAQFRAADTPGVALRIARLFVQGKIRNQRTLLMRNHAMPPASTLGRLQHAISAAASAETFEELLGIEGAAALAYFQDFSGMIKTTGDDILDAIADGSLSGTGPASTAGDPLPAASGGGRRRNGRRDTPGQEFFRFDFTRRNRRPPRDAVNALLSLAYSILAKDCTSAAHAVGFDPYVGFYHQPRFGRPALALDLMEEFRPIVADSVVLTLINTRMIGPSDFVRAGDAVNLSPAGRKQFFNAYEQRMRSMITHPVFDYKVSYRRALELQARLLAKALTGEIAAYVPFTTR